MDETSGSDAPRAPGRLAFRLAVGLIQGLAIAFLMDSLRAKHWPATDARIFAPAAAIAAYWPILLLVSVNLRRVVFFERTPRAED